MIFLRQVTLTQAMAKHPNPTTFATWTLIWDFFFGTLQVRGALFHVIDQSTFEDFAIEHAIQWDINPYKSYKRYLNIGCPVRSCVHIIAQVQSPTRPAPCLCLASSTAGRHWCLLALTQQKLSEHVPTLPEKVKTTCVL